MITQLQAILILAFCPKTAVALMAGADLFVKGLFLCVDFGMDFDHCGSPTWQWANELPRLAIEEKRLTGSVRPVVRDFTQRFSRKSSRTPQ
ncbi:MAG TPA: hypothetical protein VMH31_01895 [Methylomirabilota bacterium]|nr:hypothetical protein [Methylomirabilota bacterium]